MRCKTCQYQLWNIPGRACPECSTPFRPSDYQFQPNSVEFLCPHCQQVYYGTGEHGHLEPTEFDCVKCGNHVHMDQMILRPVNPDEENQIAATPNPWTRRAEIGRFTAFSKTAQLGATAPHQLMDGTPLKGGSGAAIGFALIVFLGTFLVSFGFSTLWMVGVMSIESFSTGTSRTQVAIMGFTGVSLVASLIIFGLSILMAHFILRITGPLRGGLGCTTKAMSYTTGPILLTAIPCCGSFISIVVMPWWCVCSAIALVRIHKVHPIRAILAVLALPMLPFLLVLGGAVLLWKFNY